MFLTPQVVIKKMIPNYPYTNSSYYRYYPHFSYTQNSVFRKHNNTTVNQSNITQPKKIVNSNTKKTELPKEDRQFFEILGIKLYFDDILLICLIFFLYNEGVQDQSLFICLILLLLS